MPFNPRYEIDARGRAIPSPAKPSPIANVGLGLNTTILPGQAGTILDWRGEDNNATDVRIFVGVNDGTLNPYEYINAPAGSGLMIPARNAPNGNRSNIVKVIFGVGSVSNEFYMDASPAQSAVLPAAFVRVDGVNVSPDPLEFSATITRSEGAGKNELYLTQRFFYDGAGVFLPLNIPAYARSARFSKVIGTPALDLTIRQLLSQVVVPGAVDTFVLDLTGETSVLTLACASISSTYEVVWTLVL